MRVWSMKVEIHDEILMVTRTSVICALHSLLIASTVKMCLLWLLRPLGHEIRRFRGEIFGASSIVLEAVALPKSINSAVIREHVVHIFPVVALNQLQLLHRCLPLY